jgi:hypothetical protein
MLRDFPGLTATCQQERHIQRNDPMTIVLGNAAVMITSNDVHFIYFPSYNARRWIQF